MFKFLKKIPKPSPESQTALPKYSEEELEKFKQELEDLLQVKEEHLDDAQYFEKLGLLYAQVSQEEEAIKNLEKSLSIKLSMGDGYKKLMSLYNQKRREAARSHDDELIEYYMGKMDDMRNIAKKVTLTAKED
ncbi:tetratricopeptide repeat protein [Streptococcus tangpeifui]|uniref:tetratricopeptide repeat protein n=1 Tax=Streptococcus tangpeifui TaxID=2709400 RepID=UPI0013EA28A3|nr:MULTISPECIES: tetratricopeptide repeat protein [unclassified Streptococcus]